MALTRKKEIAAISTPLVFPGSDNSVWQSLSAFCHEGMHYLTVAGPDGRWISTSRDLRRWQEFRPLSEEDSAGTGRCVRRRLLQGASFWGIYLPGNPAGRCSCI